MFILYLCPVTSLEKLWPSRKWFSEERNIADPDVIWDALMPSDCVLLIGLTTSDFA